jgi:hypothetical protein
MQVKSLSGHGVPPRASRISSVVSRIGAGSGAAVSEGAGPAGVAVWAPPAQACRSSMIASEAEHKRGFDMATLSLRASTFIAPSRLPHEASFSRGRPPGMAPIPRLSAKAFEFSVDRAWRSAFHHGSSCTQAT